MKPLEGAESEGAVGFFKGMGKGIVGYVLSVTVLQEVLKHPK
jgi:vacuolar protein sorting-associated protein 13A/C